MPLRAQSELLEENLLFLQEQDPYLLEEIAGADPYPFKAATVEAEAFSLTLGERVVHHLETPLAEARSKIKGSPSPVHLHFGLGLGYFLQADLPQPAGVIFVFEPDPRMVRTALEVQRFQSLYTSRKMVICCNFSRYCYVVVQRLVFRSVYRYFVSTAHAHLYRDAFGLFQTFLGQLNTEVALTPNNALYPTMIRSSWISAPYQLQQPGVEYWHNRLKGKPAVLVAAGPSLAKNVADLIPYRDKVVVFAISRVAEILEQHGIEPDFLVHVEAQDFYSFIESRTNLKQTRFLLADQAEVRYFQHPAASRYVFHSRYNPLMRSLAQAYPETKRAIVKTGGNVATAAFFIAAMAGCNPIVLIGQDLAKGETWYADPDAPSHDHERLVRVPGYYGDTVTTLPNYANNIVWYNQAAPQLLKQDPQRVLINATEGGAKLEGFQQMPFREAAFRYFQTPIHIEEPDLSGFQPVSDETWREIQQRVQRTQQRLALAREGFCEWEKKVLFGFNKGSVEVDALPWLESWQACFVDDPWLLHFLKAEAVTVENLIMRAKALPLAEQGRLAAALSSIYQVKGLSYLTT